MIAEIDEAEYQRIQQGMLTSLGSPIAPMDDELYTQISMAEDLEALWYLRSDLMQVLCIRHGERHARNQMESISAQFERHLPAGIRTSRRQIRSRQRMLA